MGLEPSRTAFLTDLMATFASNPAYSASWGADTDMTISSNPIDARWGMGDKRVEYAAALKAVEAERTVYFWEMLNEKSSGPSLETLESETPPIVGAELSGTKAEAVIRPGSASWAWGYGTQREHVAEVAARHGFDVKTVVARQSATW
jgi:hypothetical protein